MVREKNEPHQDCRVVLHVQYNTILLRSVRIYIHNNYTYIHVDNFIFKRGSLISGDVFFTES